MPYITCSIPEISTVADRLLLTGLTLPVVSPNGNYRLAIVAGRLVFTAGQLARRNGEVFRGSETTTSLSRLQEAAHIAVLRAIAAIASVVEIEQVEQFVSMTGYITSSADYAEHSRVMDSASDTLLALFGDQRGAHVRTAVGVSSLPSAGLVEIELSAYLKEEVLTSVRNKTA